jgi:hypothetical protein
MISPLLKLGNNHVCTIDKKMSTKMVRIHEYLAERKKVAPSAKHEWNQTNVIITMLKILTFTESTHSQLIEKVIICLAKIPITNCGLLPLSQLITYSNTTAP